MTLKTSGGLAAIVCAASYLIGFALLLTLLAPLGYGSNEIDPGAVVGFIGQQGGVLIAWNTVIYIVNALALAVLVVALSDHLRPAAPGWAQITKAFGLIWATLVLGAGMIANVAVELAAVRAETDPEVAARLWDILHAVELGLGGGNEIAGGVWILCVSLAAWRGRLLHRMGAGLGILTGVAGLSTLLPPLGEVAGSLFGLGAILWFLVVGRDLLRSGGRETA